VTGGWSHYLVEVDNRRLIPAANMRELALADAPDYSDYSQVNDKLKRGLKQYYSQRRPTVGKTSVYRQFFEHERKLRELGICTVALLTGAVYEYKHHAPDFLKAGGATISARCPLPIGAIMSITRDSTSALSLTPCRRSGSASVRRTVWRGMPVSLARRTALVSRPSRASVASSSAQSRSPRRRRKVPSSSARMPTQLSSGVPASSGCRCRPPRCSRCCCR
jgi:hypothetical protein